MSSPALNMDEVVIIQDQRVAILHDGKLQFPQKLATGQILYPMPDRVNELLRAKVSEAYLTVESQNTNIYEE